jgi:hypothetical protein
MYLSPPILALLCCSAVVCGLTVAAAAVGLSVVAGWDHRSGDRRQLLRERRWFLVESSLRMILALQLLSLLVFVTVADQLKTLLAGAMCAVGSLNANPFGMPSLALKSTAFVLCGMWLVADRATPAAASTGLVRFKVVFLVVLAGALIADSALQIRYFADLDPEVITSCCATIFDPDGAGVAGGLAGLSVGSSRVMFFGGLAVTIGVGLRVLGGGHPFLPYSILAAALGLITAAAVISWIAPSYYELPTHHCPLCLLASESGYVGYPLYLLLATAVIFGVGCGLVRVLRRIDVHRCIRAGEERRLCAVSVVSFVAVAVIATWPLLTSPFRLEGY